MRRSRSSWAYPRARSSCTSRNCWISPASTLELRSLAACSAELLDDDQAVRVGELGGTVLLVSQLDLAGEVGAVSGLEVAAEVRRNLDDLRVAADPFDQLRDVVLVRQDAVELAHLVGERRRAPRVRVEKLHRVGGRQLHSIGGQLLECDLPPFELRDV